jgi:hypothetical protein
MASGNVGFLKFQKEPFKAECFFLENCLHQRPFSSVLLKKIEKVDIFCGHFMASGNVGFWTSRQPVLISQQIPSGTVCIEWSFIQISLGVLKATSPVSLRPLKAIKEN